MPIESPGTLHGELYFPSGKHPGETLVFSLSAGCGIPSSRWAGPVDVEAPKGWALELDGLQCKSGLDIFPDE